MRVKADFDLCESNAVCVGLAPTSSTSTTMTTCRFFTKTCQPNMNRRCGRRSPDAPKAALSIEE